MLVLKNTCRWFGSSGLSDYAFLHVMPDSVHSKIINSKVLSAKLLSELMPKSKQMLFLKIIYIHCNADLSTLLKKITVWTNNFF